METPKIDLYTKKCLAPFVFDLFLINLIWIETRIGLKSAHALPPQGEIGTVYAAEIVSLETNVPNRTNIRITVNSRTNGFQGTNHFYRL